MHFIPLSSQKSNSISRRQSVCIFTLVQCDRNCAYTVYIGLYQLSSWSDPTGKDPKAHFLKSTWTKACISVYCWWQSRIPEKILIYALIYEYSIFFRGGIQKWVNYCNLSLAIPCTSYFCIFAICNIDKIHSTSLVFLKACAHSDHFNQTVQYFQNASDILLDAIAIGDIWLNQ